MLSIQEKIEIVLICGENMPHRQVSAIFNERHPEKNLQHSTVSRIMSKFRETGSVQNNFKKPHAASKYDEAAQLDVCLTVIDHGQTSVTKISDSTGCKRESVRKILQKNRFRAYKPKFINTLKERDFDIRLDFSFWYQGQYEENILFPYKILWTDEATFSSNGTVSSQNCRWWSQENPNFTIECRDQYHFKTNVWCGILKDELIGPYFFRVNLTGERYLNFLDNEITEVLDNMPLHHRHNLWYQLDGAPIHQTVAVKERINQLFQNRVIGRDRECHWPPRSPDITPLDFFLWGYLKQKVYKNRPFRNIEHLEQTIRQCCADIRRSFLQNAVKDVYTRTGVCIEREGRHTEM